MHLQSTIPKNSLISGLFSIWINRTKLFAIEQSVNRNTYKKAGTMQPPVRHLQQNRFSVKSLFSFICTIQQYAIFEKEECSKKSKARSKNGQAITGSPFVISIVGLAEAIYVFWSLTALGGVIFAILLVKIFLLFRRNH